MADVVNPRTRIEDDPATAPMHHSALFVPSAYSGEPQFDLAEPTIVAPPVRVDDGPTGDLPTDGTSRIIRRQRIFIAVASAAALVSVAGLFASTFVKSPAQLAAEQGPPAPSALTAPVVKEVLTQTVVVRGTVVAASSLSVTPNAAQGATTLVVTRVVKHPGDAVSAGDVIVEVSGRPLIALAGSTPAYRDLQPGDTGTDVGELQSALKGLGYADADKHGTFGSGTKAAVTRLYEHLGYTVPTTGGAGDTGDTSALQAAAQQVTDAGRTVSGDQQAVGQAQSALNDAMAADPPDPDAVTSAQTALAQAKQALSYARQDLTTAKQARAHLIATTGVEMPLDEFVFVPSLPAHVAALSAVLGAPVTAPLVTLDTGSLVVDCVLEQGEQSLIKTGLSVQLNDEQLNQKGAGTVANIGPYNAGSQTQTGQGGGQNSTSQTPGSQEPAGYPIIVKPSPALPAAWLGQDVQVTIAAAATPGPVMVVPVAAVSTGQDGATSVTVLKSDGTRVRVPVTAGLDSNGLVQVTPVTPGGLAAGDQVIIG